MITAAEETIRWEGFDNEWAHVDILYKGDTTPGRVVNWGDSQGYPNIGVVLEDPERGQVRVASAPTPEVGKRWLLAIAGDDPSVLETPVHTCDLLTHWLETYRTLGGKGDVVLQREYGIWSVKAGRDFLLMDIKACPFCGSMLS